MNVISCGGSSVISVIGPGGAPTTTTSTFPAAHAAHTYGGRGCCYRHGSQNSGVHWLALYVVLCVCLSPPWREIRKETRPASGVHFLSFIQSLALSASMSLTRWRLSHLRVCLWFPSVQTWYSSSEGSTSSSVSEGSRTICFSTLEPLSIAQKRSQWAVLTFCSL